MSFFKKAHFLKVVLAITFILITVFAFVYPDDILRFIPLYFSMGIMFLSSKANRFSFIFGALNCILYSFVFMKLKLYSSVASSLFMSLPLQIMTFILWGKNKYKKTTIFKKLTKKQIVTVSIISVVAWVMLNTITSFMGAENTLLDSFTFVLGTVATLLTMLQYIEYTYVSLVSNIVTLVLYLTILPAEPSQITYVIYQIYAVICIFVTRSTVMAYYREQRRAELEKSV